MSWRRFRNLYTNLSPHSATYRNYDRLARHWQLGHPDSTPTAWDILTGLARPGGEGK